mgnify:CR=1 FL=1
MRTISSVNKINTNYSKFEHFIDDVLAAMDISDEGKPDPRCIENVNPFS